MIKTITINTDTHCVVPKGMVYELPGLPMPISKGEFSKDLFDGFQMHQYAMRYLDEAIAAAPQPEPVDVDPMAMLPFAILDDELADLRRFTDCADDGEGYDVPKNRMKRLAEIGLLRHVSAGYYEHTVFGLSVLNGDFTTPQPDRVAELEQLHQRVAELEKERDELIEVKAAENASWNAGFNVQVDQLKKLTAERDAALNEARDFESDVDTVTQHNVELQLETIALKSALKVAREALDNCAADYLHADSVLTDSALAKINEVLK